MKNFGYQFWKDPQNQQRFFDGTDGMEQREMQRRTLFARFTRDPLAADVAKRVPAEPETVIYLFVYRPAGVDFYRIDGRNGSWAE